mgnify:FL=1
MKYGYYGGIKTGKFLMRSQFQYNKKTYTWLNTGYKCFAQITKPTVDDYHIVKWLWYDKSNKYHEWYELRHLKTQEELLEQTMETHDYASNNYFRHKTCAENPSDFWKIFPEVLKTDLIVNPLVLLGYTGMIGSREMNWSLTTKNPDMMVPNIDDIIKDLRQRHNVIPYKENMYEFVYRFFLGGDPHMLENQGEEYFVREHTNRINRAIRFQKLLPKVLEWYRIPYEMFNLDRDDYCKTFGLDKVIDRTATDNHFINLSVPYRKKAKQWTEEFLKNT